MEGQETGSAEPGAAEPGTFEQFLNYMADGGPVLYLLVVISVIALTIIIAKLIQFYMLRINKVRFVDSALLSWRAGRVPDALATLREQRNPVARVLEVALNGSTRGYSEEALVKEEVARVAGQHLDNLRTGLRPLAFIATVSPLIGLLGTVLGMINAFQALQAAGNRVDPSILSGGIWVALLTTAAGLIVAIPAATAHNWMEGLVYKSQRAMEDAVTHVFTARLSDTEPAPDDLGGRLSTSRI